MSPRAAVQEIRLSIDDFSKGIIGGISERGIKAVNWLAAATNIYGRPYRGARVRPGSRDLSSAILSLPPHSLMGYYNTGGNKLFVAADSSIFEVGATAYTGQALPAGHPESSDIFLHTNLDGVLVATQRGGSLTPLMYDGSWKELKLPKPTSAVTFGANGTLTGGVDPGTNGHYYRVRWRYAKGSSLSGPVSAKQATISGTEIVNIVSGLVPASPRSDFIGWTLERTKLNAPSSVGPWWFVADGNSTTYADVIPDASLGYMADEGIHSEPPHVDGITAFTNRLAGWAGSFVYLSQRAFGDVEGTGIANWDPDLIYPVTKDDGDHIRLCLVLPGAAVSELLILKGHSVSVLSGTDPDSYVLTEIVYADPSRGSEAGCAGPRAGCVIGGTAYFWGESGGLFTYTRGTFSYRGSVKPAAWMEMGHYFDDANPAALDNLLLVNHQGNYMLAWYPSGTSTQSRDQILLDARLPRWWHWEGWAARDAIELKSGILGAASLAFCDPTNHSTFGAIAAGTSVSGPGIAPNSLVLADVPAGANQFFLSVPATSATTDVSLVVGAVTYPHCNTVAGSTVVTIAEYHCWSAFEGFTDEKDVFGAGGSVPAVMFETPWLDWGAPDDWKELSWLSFSAEGDDTSVTVSIATDPPGGETALSLSTTGQGLNWGPDTGDGTDDLTWDIGDWASSAPSTAVAGIEPGTIGKRFKITVTATPTGDFRPSGLGLVADLLPDRDYS